MKRLILYIALLLFTTHLVNAQEEAVRNPDVMPEYPGGPDAMMKFIQTNLKYPTLEKRENQGSFGCKSLVEFTVDTLGVLKQIYIIRSCTDCSGCDAEAIKVFEKMPPWKPGMQNGKKVAVKMGMPIFFTFK